jgi:AraC-like DNA-binding protein
VSDSWQDMASNDAQPVGSAAPFGSHALCRHPGSQGGAGAVSCRGARDSGPEQFEALSRFISQRLMPTRLSTNDVGSFHAGVRSTSLGEVHLLDMWACNPLACCRTSKLITSSDPHYLKVALQLRGVSVVSQGDQQATLGPGDLVLYDTGRPYQVSGGASGRMHSVIFPRDALRLSPVQLQRLTTRRISGRDGLGSVVCQYLVGLGRQLHTGTCSASWHLSEATLDLLGALFAERLACTGATELDSGKAGLLLRVRAYIKHRLGDPGLDIATIAAAHHVSIRSLQKLFESQGQTVTGWIRAQRLECCRKDLANPTLAERPVSSVGASWGIVDAAHFSRSFRSTYGLSPREYRAKKLAELRTGAT